MEKLKEWTIEYIKHKDLFKKSIIDIKINDVIHVKTKDKEQVYVVMSSLEGFQEAIEYAEKDAWVVLVCHNTKKNLDALIKNWQTFAKYSKLSTIFANPDSKMDKKWLLYPSTHNKICDPANLKTGLEAMFAMVDEYME